MKKLKSIKEPLTFNLSSWNFECYKSPHKFHIVFLCFLLSDKTPCVFLCAFHANSLLLLTHVCVCVCMCVCLFVCVLISFYLKGFSWLNETISVMPEFRSVMVCWWKCFCMKDLCHRIKDNYRKNFQVGNCAKKCQLNREKSEK